MIMPLRNSLYGIEATAVSVSSLLGLFTDAD